MAVDQVWSCAEKVVQRLVVQTYMEKISHDPHVWAVDGSCDAQGFGHGMQQVRVGAVLGLECDLQLPRLREIGA